MRSAANRSYESETTETIAPGLPNCWSMLRYASPSPARPQAVMVLCSAAGTENAAMGAL